MHGKGELRGFMRNEMEMMNQLNHPKLIRLYDAFEGPHTFTLVTEMYPFITFLCYFVLTILQFFPWFSAVAALEIEILWHKILIYSKNSIIWVAVAEAMNQFCYLTSVQFIFLNRSCTVPLGVNSCTTWPSRPSSQNLRLLATSVRSCGAWSTCTTRASLTWVSLYV